MNEKSQYERDKEARECLIKAIYGILVMGIVLLWDGLYLLNLFCAIIGLGFVVLAWLLFICVEDWDQESVPE